MKQRLELRTVELERWYKFLIGLRTVFCLLQSAACELSCIQVRLEEPLFMETIGSKLCVGEYEIIFESYLHISEISLRDLLTLSESLKLVTIQFPLKV
jgi:hypothetical protein